MVVKQLPLNFTRNLGLLKKSNVGLRLLSGVAAGLILSPDKPVVLVASKYIRSGSNIKWFYDLSPVNHFAPFRILYKFIKSIKFINSFYDFISTFPDSSFS